MPTLDHTTHPKSGPPYYCGNGHGPNWNHGTCWCGSSYLTHAGVEPRRIVGMTSKWGVNGPIPVWSDDVDLLPGERRDEQGRSRWDLLNEADQAADQEAGRVALPAVLATLLLALAAAAVVLAFTPGVGAQTIDAPVSYKVGDVLVFSSRTRNSSCSVTRNIANTGDQPLRVIGSASWPGHPVHLPPNQGDHDGDQVLAPGEQATAVWTNSHYVTDGPIDLTWTVLVPDGTAQIGANRLERVAACAPTTETSATSPPPVSPSAPPETTGPPPTVPAPPVTSTTAEPPPATVVEVTTPATATAVAAQRAHLPVTGRPVGWWAGWAAAAISAGGLLVLLGRRLRWARETQTTLPKDSAR